MTLPQLRPLDESHGWGCAAPCAANPAVRPALRGPDRTLRPGRYYQHPHPLNAETQHLIDDQVLGQMKRGVLLVNTSHQAYRTREVLTNIAKAAVASLDDWMAHQSAPHEL